MNQEQEQLQALQGIKQLMERSSKFSSISGIAGVVVGVLATLVFAGITYFNITDVTDLAGVFTITLAFSLIAGVYFSVKKAKKRNEKVWDSTARRFVLNFFIPLLVGGIMCLLFAYHQLFQFIPSFMLVFYGMALLNASKFSIDTIWYLAALELILGIAAAFFVDAGLWFWMIGFGILHIVYGFIIYYKYEQ
jgi:hypothetical protein